MFNNSKPDCQKIWRSHGWVPPSEYRTDYLFLHKWGTKINGKPKRKPGRKGSRKHGVKK